MNPSHWLNNCQRHTFHLCASVSDWKSVHPFWQQCHNCIDRTLFWYLTTSPSYALVQVTLYCTGAPYVRLLSVFLWMIHIVDVLNLIPLWRITLRNSNKCSHCNKCDQIVSVCTTHWYLLHINLYGMSWNLFGKLENWKKSNLKRILWIFLFE